MFDHPSTYRWATPADAPALADLIDMAGDGLPSFVWAGMARAGETAADVGRRRAAREEGAFSYRNAVVADPGGGPVAALIGYPLPEVPQPIDHHAPPMFLPLQEIENLACGTWYVNALAAYPGHRGQGHGSRLLGIAGGLARDSGHRTLSLVVVDANTDALRLYERLGFRLAASRPLVKDGWPGRGDHVLLLTCDATG